MAVRSLLVLTVVAIFYGCGQSNSPPEQGEKAGDVEPKSVSPADSGQQDATQQEITLQHGINGGESTSLDHHHEADDGSSHQEDGSSHQQQCEAATTNFRPLVFDFAGYMGAPTRLMTQPNDCSSISISTWSPDGNKIVGQVGSPSHTSQIYVIDVSGREDEVQSLKLTEGPGWNSAPSWSPDGTEIAFTYTPDRKHCLGPNANYPEKYCYRAGVPAVYKMDADGSELTRLTHSPDSEGYPTWSPNAKKLTFVRYSPAREESGIYTMNSDGSNYTLVRKFVATNGVQSLDW
jgi:hypothetical protein